MSEELLYTSAPEGLKLGSRGFCTVIASRGVSAALSTLLESLSGYRHLQDPGQPGNPIMHRHVRTTIAGQPLHILSRVADAGLDYSGRSNKIAHHLSFETRELNAAGPAWTQLHSEVHEQSWNGKTETLSAGRSMPNGSESPRPCLAWEHLTGDAGWAGVLVAKIVAGDTSPVSIITPKGIDTLALVAEAIALLPEQLRWRATYTTFHTSLPPGVECAWRFIPDGTNEAITLRKRHDLQKIDLCSPLGPPPAGPWVVAARSGQRPAAKPTALTPTPVVDAPGDTVQLGEVESLPTRSVGSSNDAYELDSSGPSPPPPPGGRRRRPVRQRVLLSTPSKQGSYPAWLIASLVSFGMVLLIGVPLAIYLFKGPVSSFLANRPAILAEAAPLQSKPTTVKPKVEVPKEVEVPFVPAVVPPIDEETGEETPTPEPSSQLPAVEVNSEGGEEVDAAANVVVTAVVDGEDFEDKPPFNSPMVSCDLSEVTKGNTQEFYFDNPIHTKTVGIDVLVPVSYSGSYKLGEMDSDGSRVLSRNVERDGWQECLGITPHENYISIRRLGDSNVETGHLALALSVPESHRCILLLGKPILYTDFPRKNRGFADVVFSSCDLKLVGETQSASQQVWWIDCSISGLGSEVENMNGILKPGEKQQIGSTIIALRQKNGELSLAITKGKINGQGERSSLFKDHGALKEYLEYRKQQEEKWDSRRKLIASRVREINENESDSMYVEDDSIRRYRDELSSFALNSYRDFVMKSNEKVWLKDNEFMKFVCLRNIFLVSTDREFSEFLTIAKKGTQGRSEWMKFVFLCIAKEGYRKSLDKSEVRSYRREFVNLVKEGKEIIHDEELHRLMGAIDIGFTVCYETKSLDNTDPVPLIHGSTKVIPSAPTSPPAHEHQQENPNE